MTLNNVTHTLMFFIKTGLSYIGITIVDSDLDWILKAAFSGIIATIFSIVTFEYKKWRSKNDNKKID